MLDVWGDAAPEGSRTLDVHIGTLRSRLGDDPAAPWLIHTVRGVGFRLGPQAERQTDADGSRRATDGWDRRRTRR